MRISLEVDMQGLIPDGSASINSEKPLRIYYLDWLRVIATLGVFLYHAVRPFDLQDWLIKNEEQSAVVTLIFVVFLGTFGMALFFFVSGASTWFALQRRTAGQFALERAKRLLIPFIVCSILLHPIQEYLKWIHKGWFIGSFFSTEFFSEYLESRPGPAPGNVLNPDYFYEYTEFLQSTVFIKFGEHLWFLGFLFAFSIISIPLFLWLRGDTGKRFIDRLLRVVESRGGILLFVLPPAICRLVLQPFYPEYTDWSDFIFMLVFFVLGYICFTDECFSRIIQRDWVFGLIIGAINTILIITLLALGVGIDWIKTPETPGFYLAWFIVSLNAWCWVIVALYCGMHFLNLKNKLLDYGQEAMMSIYLFHHLMIVIVAFYVVQWKTGIVAKMLVVIFVSFATTMAIHELIIKRVEPLRAVLGLKTPK